MSEPNLTVPLSVLFIGNSYTQRNDLPAMLVELAAASRPPSEISTDRIVVNGASLRLHWNAGKATELLHSRTWDVVVLQEQSTLPIKNAKRYHENVRLFAEEVQKAGSRLVLYVAWARRNAPETQCVLNKTAAEISREVGAEIAPVGSVWERVRTLPGAPELFESDGSHPTAAGSYLAACVFYVTLLGRNPMGLPAPKRLNLTDEQLCSLQTTAWGEAGKLAVGGSPPA